ncbi:MAG: hypothetical protein ACLPVF_18710 [Acidimicrobiales bacterium]
MAEEVGSAAASATEKDRDTIREMIRHEDSLRDQRLGWFLALNGLLFAGLGFAWSTDDANHLVVVFAILGVVIGLTTWVGMTISTRAIHELKAWADVHAEPGTHDLLPVAGIDSADLHAWQDTFAPWKVLPWALVVVWIALPIVRAYW